MTAAAAASASALRAQKAGEPVVGRSCRELGRRGLGGPSVRL